MQTYADGGSNAEGQMRTITRMRTVVRGRSNADADAEGQMRRCGRIRTVVTKVGASSCSLVFGTN